MINLCEFNLDSKWTLLYRASQDGYRAEDFHSKCDGHENTLTIIKVHESLNTFGGFTQAAWSSKLHGFKIDPQAFIFSLINSYNQPCKINVDQNRIVYAIHCDPYCGPSFGVGNIHLENNCQFDKSSFAFLGDSYQHPQYSYGSREALSFLGGTPWFQISEIEVFKKE